MTELSVLIQEALNIQEVIYQNGGMANKSAVEDVLMAKFEDLDRHDAHEITNRIEYGNLKPPDRRFTREPGPTVEEYAPYMEGVRIRWFRGSPLA